MRVAPAASPPHPLHPTLATAVAVTCRNPVLQSSQISVAADFYKSANSPCTPSTHSPYSLHNNIHPSTVWISTQLHLLTLHQPYILQSAAGVGQQMGTTGWHGQALTEGEQRNSTQHGQLDSFAERSYTLVMPQNRIQKGPWSESCLQSGYAYWYIAVFSVPTGECQDTAIKVVKVSYFWCIAYVTLTLDTAPWITLIRSELHSSVCGEVLTNKIADGEYVIMYSKLRSFFTVY
jgi:hypothetical protein